MTAQLTALLTSHLEDPSCAFSVGGFGALAEFQDPEARIEQRAGRVTAYSPRGALAAAASGVENVLAYETLSAREDAWQHGVAIYADAAAATGAQRACLTELGPDVAAVRERDREALLFDLGVGLPNADFCIRTRDAALIELLRRHLGASVVRAGHPVLEAMIDASPDRVVSSRFARIEVCQKIDRHQTPAGPHTHLLPDLLGKGRTHSARVPLPPGAMPLLTLHPENPLVDAEGHPRDFSRAAFDRFQRLLERCGDATYVAEKRRLAAALERAVPPDAYPRPASRIARLAHRVTLRQLTHLGGDAATIDQWKQSVRA
ncbi:MAG: DUF6925 family protein [Gammaproteobacteria bacterium]